MEKTNKYSEQYILSNGTNFDDLWFASETDEILDGPEDQGGKPFTGIAYEVDSNNKMVYYTFYKNGFQHGLNCEFYKNGNLKKEETYIHGLICGKSVSWYENGKVRSISEMELSIPITYQEWDESGNLIKNEKLEMSTDNFKYEMLLDRRERFRLNGIEY